MKPKVLLIVLDGYGHGKNYRGNAILRAKSPFLKKIRKKYPTAILKCSGNAVGLPKGFQGGSEVGHFTIGAGRVVWQFLEEINRSIRNGNFFKREALLSAMRHVKKEKSALHLMGMISDEGVHSHIDHCFALLNLAKKQNVKHVFIHAITDGRDVPERSAQKFIKKILKKNGVIVTIVGRYYAMDRDKNWNRTQQAYNLFTQGKGIHEKDPIQAVKNAYKRGDSTDYYLKPILLEKDGIIQKKDAIIFWNYRTDRARQITQLFLKHKHGYFVCMGPYADGKTPEVIQEPKVKNNLAATLSRAKKTQTRIAETEKYAHVTLFFNSQMHKPFKGEKRILVASPKVPNYAEKPEMNAHGVTSKIIHELKQGPDVIIANFANADLVGHSGDFKATKKCCEVLNDCVQKIIPIALRYNYDILLAADHGNAEYMIYKNGDPCPSHTKNPIACTLISNKKHLKLKHGESLGLKNIAPTILQLLNIKKPKEMTGTSLLTQ